MVHAHMKITMDWKNWVESVVIGGHCHGKSWEGDTMRPRYHSRFMS